MRSNGLRFAHILSAMIFFLCLGVSVNAGSYKDRDSNVHVWSVNPNHSLMWDGVAYLPFGFVYNPVYLSEIQSDENLAADKASLEALKKAGITDILLRPGKGLSTVPVEAFQRVIDLLEESGFRYGVQLLDSDRTPFSGYVIEPAVNRIDNIQESGEVKHSIPDSKFALWFLADAKTSAIKGFQQAIPTSGEFIIPVELGANTPHVLLLYPLKEMPSTIQNPNISDIWTDYDRFRDLAVSYLSQIKFGRGLRFFVDPFGDAIGMQSDAINTIPVSGAYRLEYAAWLAKKYNTPHALNKAWGLTTHDVTSYAEAAGFIPLWSQGRGLKLIYDDIAGKRYEAIPEKSTIWNDFIAFRNYSIMTYLDGIADVVKRSTVDVPVVHTVNGLSSIFQGTANPGFDGLAVPALDGLDLMLRAGSVLSIAENSVRKPWLISKVSSVGSGFSQKEFLFDALNTVYNLGSKGFFIDGASSADANLTTWLAEYAAISAKDSFFANYMPRVIYYQVSTEKAEVRKLAGGAWWIPTLAAGRSLFLGSTLSGYTLDAAVGSGTGIYIWSLKGTQVIHLVVKTPISVVKASGESLDIVPDKKGNVAVEVGKDPIIIRGIAPEEFMPIEVVTDAMNELQATINKGKEKRMDTGPYESVLLNGKTLIKKYGNHLTALRMFQDATAELKHRLQGMVDINPATMGNPETAPAVEKPK
ncbi:MAG: hypothetical protein ACYC0V_16890 [Armatimonadota bacterium]